MNLAVIYTKIDKILGEDNREITALNVYTKANMKQGRHKLGAKQTLTSGNIVQINIVHGPTLYHPFRAHDARDIKKRRKLHRADNMIEDTTDTSPGK